MPEFPNINELLPLLVPVAILQLILLLVALIHLLRHKKTRNLNVWGWGAIILLVNIIGPILYLTVGRADE
jgi:hypothetical protein